MYISVEEIAFYPAYHVYFINLIYLIHFIYLIVYSNISYPIVLF